MTIDPLSSRNLARHGMRRSAYDGANRRRFVLSETRGDGNELRSEFDTKGERDCRSSRQIGAQVISIPLGHGARGVAAISGAMANRHGLICGTTGTGKTWTLATLAEGFSRIGTPCVLVDVKGDLSGLALPGRGEPAPVQFLDVFATHGAPMCATAKAFGTDLLARVLDLSAVQSEILGALFASHSGRLDTLGDVARALGAPHGFRATRASVDSIRRALVRFRQARSILWPPGFDIATRGAPSGRRRTDQHPGGRTSNSIAGPLCGLSAMASRRDLPPLARARRRRSAAHGPDI